jgi:two-component sensor histidine kinase
MKKSDLLHNINNPLTIINGNAKIVARKTADQDIMNAMENITGAANRIAEYLRGLSEDNEVTYAVLRIRKDDYVDEVFKCHDIDSLRKYIKKFPLATVLDQLYIDRSYSTEIISADEFLQTA